MRPARPTACYAFDDTNERVFHLDPRHDLIQRPLGVRFVEQTLGRTRISVTAPGSRPMHADQGYVLPPGRPAAGLQRRLAAPHRGERRTRYCPAPIARAGARLGQHGGRRAACRQAVQTGANRSHDSRRAALFFVKRWLRPQINWNAALWPEHPRAIPRWATSTGNVEGADPDGRRAVVCATSLRSATARRAPDQSRAQRRCAMRRAQVHREAPAGVHPDIAK
jgi:hypothetical protein